MIPVRQIVAWMYGCYVWSLFTLILLLFGGFTMSLHKPPVGRRIVRFGARLLFMLARIPLSASGLDRLPAQPHILLVNHSSFLDGLVLTALLPASPGYAFVVRQEFDAQRFLCPLLRSLGAVALNRVTTKIPEKSSIDLLASALRRRKNLVVFPEGGFRSEPGLRPFHSGAFIAAAHANVPVVVAGLRGARTALRMGTWLPHRIAITLEIGPVLTATGQDRPSIALLTTSARAAMVKLSGEPSL